MIKLFKDINIDAILCKLSQFCDYLTHEFYFWLEGVYMILRMSGSKKKQ